ncbi:hypothetical protein [Rhizobium ruizarguesonis]|uniref:hypothetical protein n=1 Tax=Rhizobium ruizarguesonis TaxID=2081791 RepID=UPI001038620F|nr:hypothetical protein [Rhizobium ruizarguesonis]TBB32618.1 hypothetical protein ELH47_12140 [Rhizobium ruizarguesonis]
MNAAATRRNRAILEGDQCRPCPGDGGWRDRWEGFTWGIGRDINVNVASQGLSGDPAKDEQHNRGMAKQVAAAIDQQMAEWTTKQMRPGGLLYGSANANSSCK